MCSKCDTSSAAAKTRRTSLVALCLGERPSVRTPLPKSQAVRFHPTNAQTKQTIIALTKAPRHKDGDARCALRPRASPVANNWPQLRNSMLDSMRRRASSRQPLALIQFLEGNAPPLPRGDLPHHADAETTERFPPRKFTAPTNRAPWLDRWW